MKLTLCVLGIVVSRGSRHAAHVSWAVQNSEHKQARSVSAGLGANRTCSARTFLSANGSFTFHSQGSMLPKRGCNSKQLPVITRLSPLRLNPVELPTDNKRWKLCNSWRSGLKPAAEGRLKYGGPLPRTGGPMPGTGGPMPPRVHVPRSTQPNLPLGWL